MMELLAENPYKTENPFVFYSEFKDKPLTAKCLLNCLKREIKKAGIELAGRKVDFHSFRHYYASRMLDKAEAEQVMRITGHRTKAVFETYSAHLEDKNIEAMAETGRKVFENILRFRPGA
jgi:integrase